jgi:hypothetical protein
MADKTFWDTGRQFEGSTYGKKILKTVLLVTPIRVVMAKSWNRNW